MVSKICQNKNFILKSCRELNLLEDSGTKLHKNLAKHFFMQCQRTSFVMDLECFE